MTVTSVASLVDGVGDIPGERRDYDVVWRSGSGREEVVNYPGIRYTQPSQ